MHADNIKLIPHNKSSNIAYPFYIMKNLPKFSEVCPHLNHGPTDTLVLLGVFLQSRLVLA